MVEELRPTARASQACTPTLSKRCSSQREIRARRRVHRYRVFYLHRLPKHGETWFYNECRHPVRRPFQPVAREHWHGRLHAWGTSPSFAVLCTFYLRLTSIPLPVFLCRHAVMNTGNEDAVSLHLYVPGITRSVSFSGSCPAAVFEFSTHRRVSMSRVSMGRSCRGPLDVQSVFIGDSSRLAESNISCGTRRVSAACLSFQSRRRSRGLFRFRLSPG